MSLRKPLIAAINGAAAGLGLVEALYADVRFCVPDAKLTTTFVRRGLIAEYGMAWLLPRIVGSSRALDLARLLRPADAFRPRRSDSARPYERPGIPAAWRSVLRQTVVASRTMAPGGWVPGPLMRLGIGERTSSDAKRYAGREGRSRPIPDGRPLTSRIGAGTR